jgi:hypothetical protein
MQGKKHVLTRIGMAAVAGMTMLVGGLLAAPPAEAAATGCTQINEGLLCNANTGEGLSVGVARASLMTPDNYTGVCGAQFRIFGQLKDGSSYDTGVGSAKCGAASSWVDFDIHQEFADGSQLCAAVKPPEKDWQQEYACIPITA